MRIFDRLARLSGRASSGRRGGVVHAGPGGRRRAARLEPRPEPLEGRALLAASRPLGPPAGGTEVAMTGLSPAVAVDPNSLEGRAGEPAIAVAPGGETVVAWRRATDTETPEDLDNPSGIFVQRFDRQGRPQGSRIQVDGGITEYNDPDVAFAPGGGFLVAYSRAVGGREEVVVRRFGADGVGLGAPIVFGETLGQINDVRVAADARGRFVVVWRDSARDGGTAGIFARRFDAQGAAVGGVIAVNASPAGEQVQPSLAMDPGGGFVVAWKGPDPARPSAGDEILARVFRPGGRPSGPEFVVNATSAGSQRHPVVAKGPGGRFVVAWESIGQDGDGAGIVARQFGPGGRPLGREIPVNSTTAGNQAVPALAVSRSGDFVVGWQGTGPGDWMGIFGQRFRPDGRAEGPQFRLNDRAGNLQVTPALGFDGRGRLVAAWNGLGAVGADYSGMIRSFALDRVPVAAPEAVPATTPPFLQADPASDPPGSVTFAIVGDFGYSTSDEEQDTYTAPEDYVAAMVRSWDPAFVIGLGDDNYLLGRNSWFDRNVGKNYAPYITPYVAQESYGRAYPNGIPGTPPASYNRFFSVPGNHDNHDPFTSHLNFTAGRGQTVAWGQGYDSWFLPSITGSPNVTPLAGSYVYTKPYSDSYSSLYGGNSAYYDYLMKPIDSSGKVLTDLANFYMIDGYQDVNGNTGGGPDGPQAKAILASAQGRPDGAAWQIALSHYETYSSTDGGNLPGMDWDFAGNNIDLVIAGHVHNYERLAANGITYIVNGTGGFNFPIDTFSTFSNPPLPTSQARAVGFGAMKVTMSPTAITLTQYFVDTSGDGPPISRIVDTYTLNKS
jgi:hypothetical protein